MSDRHALTIDQYLIDAIRKEMGSEGTVIGVSSASLVPNAEQALSVPAVEVREAIWRLADSQEIEFTEDRRVVLKSG